jgi:hypothetical protein
MDISFVIYALMVFKGHIDMKEQRTRQKDVSLVGRIKRISQNSALSAFHGTRRFITASQLS